MRSNKLKYIFVFIGIFSISLFSYSQTTFAAKNTASIDSFMSAWQKYVTPKITAILIPKVEPIKNLTQEVKKNTTTDTKSTSPDIKIVSSVPANATISGSTLLTALRALIAKGLPEDVRNALQGPTGPAGPVGPQGPQGPAGSQGSSGYTFSAPPPASPNPSGPIGIMGGFATLGVQELNTKTIAVTSTATIQTLTVTGTANLPTLNTTTLSADTLTIGGGYGSTGVTVPDTGNISANGNLIVDGTSTLTGNVGIGTSSPTAKLDIYETGNYAFNSGQQYADFGVNFITGQGDRPNSYFGAKNVFNSLNVNILGAASFINQNNTALGTTYGAFFVASSNGANPAATYGGYSEAVFGEEGTGTNVKNIGHFFSTQNRSATGVITNNYDAFIETSNLFGGGGVITNNYGIYVNDQTAGTNNWALKTTGVGKIELGTAPTSSLWLPSAYLASIGKDSTNPLTSDSGIYTVLEIGPTFTQNSNVANYIAGSNVEITVGGSGNMTGIAGQFFGAKYTGSGILADGVYGAYSQAVQTGGTSSNVIGFQVANVISGGATTDTTGIDIYGTAISGGATAVNNIGLNVRDVTGGTNNRAIYTNQTAGANNYALYNAGTAKSYFAGNVGIGTTTPSQNLEINGGIRYNTVTAKPACDATTRGTTWFVNGANGVKDTFEACAKDATDVYAWRTIY